MSEEIKFIGYTCGDCKAGPFTKPVMACAECGSENLEEMEFSGKGKIYTFTVVHAGYGELKEKAPYCLAVVELAEGPKVITIVDDIDVEQVKVDDPVKLKSFNAEELPMFTAG